MRGPFLKPVNAEYARFRLRYSKQTGTLTWRRNGDMPANWNARFAGKMAGTVNPKGYRIVSINGVDIFAQRLIWLIVTGNWPEEEIDHKNQNKDDNRWKNLRPCSHQNNSRNRPKRTDNNSGYVGVHWCERDKIFIAQITIDGKSQVVCRSKSAETASREYERAAEDRYGEFFTRHQ